MRKVLFIGYKIAPAIELKNIAAYFRLTIPESWENYILLGEQQLTEVYKYKLPQKKIYVFEYGCIVFENFNSSETGEFIRHIQLITGELDYKMLAKYSESHEITVSEDHSVLLRNNGTKTHKENEGLSDMVAIVLAKSIALSKEEADVELLLDKAENFIIKLYSGVLNTGTRKYAKSMANILRFEYESTVSIRLFDRPVKSGKSLELRDAYNELTEYYELKDRYDILDKKVGELRNIVRSYSESRYRKQESRLLIFEIFLLALFPLFHFAQDLLRLSGYENVISILFTDLLQKFNIFY